jgi:hypothetical protein
MIAKAELTVDEYYEKWQGAVDKIATERNSEKFEVIRFAAPEPTFRIQV